MAKVIFKVENATADTEVFEEMTPPVVSDNESTQYSLTSEWTRSLRQASPKKYVKRVTFYQFTDKQEKNIAEWYRDHECFYNKKLKSFKDTKMKRQLYEEKAASLEPKCTYKQLKTFLEGMRTQYGRISKRQLNQAGICRLTDRDKWIAETFGFLDKHIVRCPNRAPAKSKKYSIDAEGSSSEDSDEEHVVSQPSSNKAATSASRTESGHSETVYSNTKTSKGKRTQKRVHQEDELKKGPIPKIIKQDNDIDVRSQPIYHQIMSEHEEQVKAYLAYLATQLRKIKPCNWFSFTLENMRMVQNYVVMGESTSGLHPVKKGANPISVGMPPSLHVNQTLLLPSPVTGPSSSVTRSSSSSLTQDQAASVQCSSTSSVAPDQSSSVVCSSTSSLVPGPSSPVTCSSTSSTSS